MKNRDRRTSSRRPSRRRRREMETACAILHLERDQDRGAPAAAAILDGARPLAEVPWPELQGLLPAFIRVLLERSAALRYEDPAAMVSEADRAAQLACMLPPRRYGPRVTADLRARALGELANAHRVADDLAMAGSMLGEASAWARRGTGDLRLAARIGDLSASLLSDERRFEEAVEQLERVQALYESLGDLHLAGRALIKQGIFTGYAGQAERAIVLLVEGLKLLEPERDPALRLSGVHAIAWHLVDAGQPRAAWDVVEGARDLYLRDGSRLNQVRLRWLEGRIAFALEEDAEAEDAFREAREQFLVEVQQFDAALVSLDLALVLAKQGRRREIFLLVDRMVATFRRLGIRREALAALVLLRRASELPGSAEALSARIRAAAALLAARG